jgi:hypothetical protein
MTLGTLHSVFERQWWQSFSKFQPVAAICLSTHRFTDSSADSGRLSVQEALYLCGFYNLNTDGHG